MNSRYTHFRCAWALGLSPLLKLRNLPATSGIQRAHSGLSSTPRETCAPYLARLSRQALSKSEHTLVQRVSMFAAMTLSLFRVALVLPLAFGCAHAVYDEQPSFDDTSNAQTAGAGAGSSNTVNSLPDPQADASSSGGSVGALGGASASNSFGGEIATGGSLSGTGSDGKSGASAGGASAGGASAGGASAGGASAGSATSNAGAPSAGGASAGGASAGGASAGGASAGASSAGGASAGASSGGSSNSGCSGVKSWTKSTYVGGDRVQSGGKLYKCKAFPYDGWCGLSTDYAPPTGFAWADAWDLVGPC